MATSKDFNQSEAETAVCVFLFAWLKNNFWVTVVTGHEILSLFLMIDGSFN